MPDENDNENDFTEIKPDWSLIDEISIPLLEQGIGTFDILQRTLPTIVLSKFDKIDDEWTESRVSKMFRIAQLQIRYILQSQQTLVKELEKERDKNRKITKTNHSFRKTMMQPQKSTRELFKCEECSKIFLHSFFLADHIQRKHRSSNISNMETDPPLNLTTTKLQPHSFPSASNWK
uniref:C2H2-type domain-containing protein n=1 Tax=Panagrolaimus sp. JU765 TaxID=591449 RepID=A0AC34QFB6_9BILA